ncbi:MAG: DUF131 domain-containing protein [Thermoplasmata archaeon]|nr:MAG: DUF131 domain-containing protein [Thermoplasmata archaeon]
MENKIPFLLFIFGIILLVLGFLKGEAGGGIFIIFPFIYGTGIFSMIGIIFIFLSIFLYFLHPFKEMQITEGYEKKSGGIIFIGPIPIIISSDVKLAFLVLMAVFIFMIIALTLIIFHFVK